MMRIKLTDEQRSLLEDRFRKATSKDERDRIQAVLMAHRRRPRAQIAEDLGRSTRTIQRWLQRFLKHGIDDGLAARKPPGAKAKIPESLAPTIIGWVKDGPEAAGLQRANWTFQELTDHLYRTHGIAVSE